jgi:hypothetical protein
MRTARVNECGHPEQKHRAKGLCQKCYYVAHRDRYIARARAWQVENPERQRAFVDKYRNTELGMLTYERNLINRRGMR